VRQPRLRHLQRIGEITSVGARQVLVAVGDADEMRLVRAAPIGERAQRRTTGENASCLEPSCDELASGRRDRDS
jgi:hypothetical protein